MENILIMRKAIFLLLLFIVLGSTLISFSSCETKKTKLPTLGKAQSAPYELLLVANKEWIKTMAGQTLSVVLNSPIVGLPQPETHFRLTTIDPRHFEGTFRFYSNVVCVQIGKEYPEAKVTMMTDAYCKPQLILNLQAPNDEEFIKLVRERADIILEMFDDRELARERMLLSKNFSGKVQAQVQKMFGYDFKAPKDIDKIKAGNNFLWGTDEKNEFRLNVCMYSVPIRNMDEEAFVSVRDSVMKINIPGDKEDQWMETDARSITMGEKEVGENSIPVTVFKGLWDMKNDAMGGPFVAYVYTDMANNRMVIAEGFIFAPQKDKRAYIRELEASLQTLKAE